MTIDDQDYRIYPKEDKPFTKQKTYLDKLMENEEFKEKFEEEYKRVDKKEQKYRYKCLKCGLVWRSTEEHRKCLNCKSESIENLKEISNKDLL